VFVVVLVNVEDIVLLMSLIEEDFCVGMMSFIWDGEVECVVIECFEIGEELGEELDLILLLDVLVMCVSFIGVEVCVFVKCVFVVVVVG